MNPKLSIIVNVYNNQRQISNQIDRWNVLPNAIKENIQFIIVDDHSDSPILIEDDSLNIIVCRILDDIPWNMPGARNLGAIVAKSDWLIFHDVDHYINENILTKLLRNLSLLDNKNLYKFYRKDEFGSIDSHVNTFLVNRLNFLNMGMYDEDFSGNYGFEDIYFNILWQLNVGPIVLLENLFFDVVHNATVGLDRDTSKNRNLLDKKIIVNKHQNSVAKIRFNWKFSKISM